MITKLIAVTAAMLVLGLQAWAQSTVRVTVNGELVRFPDTQPIVRNDNVLVPLRGVFEKLGAQVTWIHRERMATIIRGDRKIAITMGNRIAVIDGENRLMDTGPILYRQRAMVPLRFISEALDAAVAWRPEDRLVAITNVD